MSYTLCRGASAIDGGPVRHVVVLVSSNDKLGKMPNVGHFVDGMTPVEARRTGADASIGCASCGIRANCYVQWWRAARKAEGAHGALSGRVLAAFVREMKRWGSEGDPVSMSYDEFIRYATPDDIGYTHRWAVCDQRWRSHLMASCDSTEEAELARSMGWRVYLTIYPGDPIPAGAVQCPFERMKDRGHRAPIQCLHCGWCNGADTRFGKIPVVFTKLKRANRGRPTLSFGGLGTEAGMAEWRKLKEG